MRCYRIPLVGKILIAFAFLILIGLAIILPIVFLTRSDSNGSSQEILNEITTNSMFNSTTKAIEIMTTVVITKSTTISTTLTTTTTTTTTIKPFNVNELKGDESTRIDCFLDAQSRFENLNQHACEKRNCIYDSNVSHPIVPKCYFDRENLGYKLEKKLGQNEYLLTQSGNAPFLGVISSIQLNVEYYCNNIIRVKVIFNIQQS